MGKGQGEGDGVRRREVQGEWAGGRRGMGQEGEGSETQEAHTCRDAWVTLRDHTF